MCFSQILIFVKRYYDETADVPSEVDLPCELADAELEHRIADFLLYRYDKGLSLYANLEKAREMCS